MGWYHRRGNTDNPRGFSKGSKGGKGKGNDASQQQSQASCRVKGCDGKANFNTRTGRHYDTCRDHYAEMAEGKTLIAHNGESLSLPWAQDGGRDSKRPRVQARKVTIQNGDGGSHSSSETINVRFLNATGNEQEAELDANTVEIMMEAKDRGMCLKEKMSTEDKLGNWLNGQ